MNKRIFALMVGLCASLGISSCDSGSKTKSTVSGLPERVLASQGVTDATTFGGLVIINGENDTLPRLPDIGAGSIPGVMAINPGRSIVVTVDSSNNTMYGVDTTTEKDVGNGVKLLGPIDPTSPSSIIVPTTSTIGYAAVPGAIVPGYTFAGALEAVNFAGGSLETIAVPGAQSVVADSTGTYFLVFSVGSDSITLVNPALASPPVDTSCLTNSNPQICTIIPGFDRPVFAIVNGTTAYIFNCGAECGGVQASIQTLDLTTLALGTPVNVNGATYGFLNGTTLYVAGLGTPTGPTCASLTNSINPATAATYCGTLDIVNLTTMTDPYYNSPSTEIAIPDGFHNQMDLTLNGQLFVGSQGCTNIGNGAYPNGEVRGCLVIYNTTTNALVFPPDNGDVNGLQGFTTRYIEYVAEGGNLRVYDTTLDVLYINQQYLPEGTINITGYVGGVKAIDFF